ncbi:cold inducible protein Ves [Yersinia nurmii]|uniref:Cold inducible protein Ves n=1 Tax=Yersinia nurmii TaxID=685706 RepID=A0ABP1YB40_9GAMM|nr:HutD family protein [Yersinia nurmii]CNE41228.1 cold inducible protein Ves [Yersinia nurmii]
MSLTFFDYASLPVSRWRNGGGETREIACWPVGSDDFGWRASIATIEQNGPFSTFPEVERSITLLAGDGVRLYSAEGQIDHELAQPLRPFSFPGDIPLEATLLGGVSQDFNIMTRRGCWRADVSIISDAQLLPVSRAGVVYVICGDWQIQYEESRRLSHQQGCWWSPAMRGGQLRPLAENSQLMWVNLLPAV